MQSSKRVEKKAGVWTLDIRGAAETVASLVHAGYRHRAPLKTYTSRFPKRLRDKTWETQRSPLRSVDRGALWPRINAQLVSPVAISHHRKCNKENI